MGGLGLAALSSSARALPRWTAPRAAESDDERRLLLVQLSGGNDGLSTVVPHGDDAYHAARSTTRLETGELHRLDDYRGLHPELVELHARYQSGHVAIVEGVGYPNPNRSHFKALEIWHTADERGRTAGDGWIGRACEAAFGADVESNRVVHVGDVVPYSVYSGSHPAASLASPAGYRFVKNADELSQATPMERTERSGRSERLAFLRSRMQDAQASSAEIRGVVARYETPVEYPSDDFAASLRIAAALLTSGIGTRVVSVELGKFDTHVDQHDRHTSLMHRLDRGLAAVLADLERSSVGRQTLVLAFSEFGRRVQENGSRGTDHGKAGPMFLMGGRVRGGLFGEHPSLTSLDEGDLAFTTDFRSVYGEVLAGTFDVDAERVLGGRYPSLGLLG